MFNRKYYIPFFSFLLSCSFSSYAQIPSVGKLHISANHRFFVKDNGQPFFWLGDTGWLLFGKLNREETIRYLNDRQKKGFNVIQVMLLHSLFEANAYGDSALINGNVALPKVTKGHSFSDPKQYDFWDHVDYIIDEAAKRNIYIGLVPVWGSNVKAGGVSAAQAKIYAEWIADRFKNKPNIIWINGGDIKGSDSMNVWKTIGNTLREKDPNHLITFHPFGRTASSTWFHHEKWLDFNMFQSGHRSYEQDTSIGEHNFGPDNYKFVRIDYNLKPVKPTLDGEPSYEEIPHGLHDTTQPRWTDNDVRRYGYWEVFAGGAGYTYGDNSVMQMHKPSDKNVAYGSRFYWYEAIHHPGAGQMQYLKKLMLSKPYFDRIPDQSLINGNQGERYNYIAATRGKNYAFIYTCNGRNFKLNMGRIKGEKVRATWYNPGNGSKTTIGSFSNKGILPFNPPGKQKDGNDWVLILESI